MLDGGSTLSQLYLHICGEIQEVVPQAAGLSGYFTKDVK